jgi:hypothetical protein
LHNEVTKGYRPVDERVKYNSFGEIIMVFPLPNWLVEMPSGPEKERALDRFILQLACIYASREGRIRILAELIDVNYQTLKSQMSDPRLQGVSARTYLKIEQLLGPSFARPRLPTQRIAANG